MRKGVKIFSNFPAEHINIFHEAKKKGKESRFSFLAEHTNFLPGSVKRRKSSQIFPIFSCNI